MRARWFAYGPFTIRRLRSGEIDPAGYNSAFGPLAIIEHMQIESGAQIAMHQHINDENLHYVWRGSMMHKDEQDGRPRFQQKS